MLAKLSVRKPFTVLVAAIIVLMLGAVALHFMKTDLLPEFEVPYLAVVTTDPGAAPEQVETEITDVLEGAVGSLSGVKNVYSYSAENYSMIFLEFADETNMDGALVKTSAAVNEVAASLPESAGTPYYMEMSMDMVASMYLGVVAKGNDLAELTQKVDDTVIPALERQEGVANVSAAGLVVDSIDIKLSQRKIDNVNDGILGEVNGKLASAGEKIDEASRKLDRAERKLKDAQKQLDAQKNQALSGFDQASTGINQAMAAKSALQAQLATMQAQLQVLEQAGQGSGPQVEQLRAQIAALQEQVSALDAAIAKGDTLTSTELAAVLGLAEGQNQIDQGLAQIAASRQQLSQSKAQYEQQRKSARKSANIDQLVDKSTIAKLIQAQNFEMPAGYVNDARDEQWLVKVGEKIKNIGQLKKLVLTRIDGVGDVTLADVADITTSNTLGDNYAKLNGNDGIILSLTKMSTANTGDVSKAVNAQIDKLERDDADLDIIPIMDQGAYIDLYIATVLKSLLIGAALAVVVLAVFLKNVKPTLVVAFSIPFSVLFALVIMYFFGLTINIMTLGALSLAIGMLVDNSIVVMENIYRMRARGLSATRAAAQGAVQVTGAIFASTLTSICVFFPFVFTTGTVRQLMVPFALTISFALLASLLVALTVVPCLSSYLFRKRQPSEIKWFQRLQGFYARVLDASLDHKAPVLVGAVVLFAAAVGLVVNMGVVMMPEMTASQISFQLSVPEEVPKEDGYETADIVGSRIAALEGVGDVGVADNNTGASTFTGMAAAGTGDLYDGDFLVYVTVDKDKISTEQGVRELKGRVLACADGLNCTLESSSDSSGSSGGMGSLMGSSASVEILGADSARVRELADDVAGVMRGIEGYEKVETGQEDADPTLHLYIDKAAAARKNTTVAQIYQQLASRLAKSEKATTLRYQGADADVVVYDKDGEVKKDDLLGLTFTDNSGKRHKLKSVASLKVEDGVEMIYRQNMEYSADVTAEVADGYNITLLARQLAPELEKIEVPDGYSIKVAGTSETIDDMLEQMALLLVLGFLLVYLVMVAQFQSLLLPFIIIFTVPLAFTGGLFALVIAGEQLSMMALLGFVILMGTVVNNGIVFVDYVNQMRLGGLSKRAALVACGKTRMRPIIMTALTTIIAMGAMIFSQEIGASMERGMALVVAGGLLYATFMTLFVVPAIYDIFCRRPLKAVDVGSDVDDDAADAEAFIAEMGEDARETYEYETRRQRRRRKRAEKRQERD